MTKILIADDHPLIRKGLKRILENESQFQIVAEAQDGHEALALINEHLPKIAVLDLNMPGLAGLDLIREIKKHNLPTRVVVLTMYDGEELFNEAFDLGVTGYILKDNAIDDLLACLKAVAANKYYVSASISGYLVNRRTNIDKVRKEKPGLELLTETERRVLRLIAENRTSKDIAAALFISYRTVQNHRNNICKKLDLRGHNKLLQFAIENKSAL
ncbi:MAG: response regulator [bacterium]